MTTARRRKGQREAKRHESAEKPDSGAGRAAGSDDLHRQLVPHMAAELARTDDPDRGAGDPLVAGLAGPERIRMGRRDGADERIPAVSAVGRGEERRDSPAGPARILVPAGEAHHSGILFHYSADARRGMPAVGAVYERALPGQGHRDPSDIHVSFFHGHVSGIAAGRGRVDAGHSGTGVCAVSIHRRKRGEAALDDGRDPGGDMLRVPGMVPVGAEQLPYGREPADQLSGSLRAGDRDGIRIHRDPGLAGKKGKDGAAMAGRRGNGFIHRVFHRAGADAAGSGRDRQHREAAGESDDLSAGFRAAVRRADADGAFLYMAAEENHGEPGDTVSGRNIHELLSDSSDAGCSSEADSFSAL